MNYEDETYKFQHMLLDEALSKGIQRNEEQCITWAAYKNGHAKVAEALRTLPQNLHVNCMVPLGKRALMKGKLIHTNEVLACLGGGYFAKYSAPAAINLCERRIERAEEMLKCLTAERNLYETRMMLPEIDIFGDRAEGEIVEHWSEDQIKEWKIKHREREREYYQKLSELRQEERKKIETEEDLFQRLDQLEIEEELADELNRLEHEQGGLYEDEIAENECYYESGSTSDSEEVDCTLKKQHVPSSENKLSAKDIENYGTKKSVSFAEPETDTSKEKLADSVKEVNKKASEDTADSEEETFRIEFSHSQNDSAIKQTGETIETPADIYKIFSKPKSILKRSSNDVVPEQVVFPDYDTDDEEDSIKSSAYEIVVKDIKERDTRATTDNVSETENERPVSKFKRERKLKK